MKVPLLSPSPEYRRRGVLPALLLAAAGGFLNGLIGTGAGILLLYAARLLGLTREDPRAKYAFAMACVLPISALSFVLHPPIAMESGAGLRFLLPAVIGGGAGAILREKVSAVWLNRAFAVLTVLSGVLLILR